MNTVRPETPDARLLARHRSKSRCYELCGTRTASVRDQIIRAAAVTAALCAEQPLEVHAGEPLLVIGGGAAGATAAITAAEAGVPCLLIEREEHLFQRQWGVTTRWLDPTEFDWPQSHWELPHWPIPDNGDHGVMPPAWFIYEPGEAHKIARRWHDDFHTWAADQEELRQQGQPAAAPLHVEHSLSSHDCILTFSSDAVEVSCASRALPWQRFGAVISCVGQGAEKTSIAPGASFVGYPFWSTDPLGTPMAGLQEERSPRRALVSGGGDGAQQDLQRILCGDFGRRLLVDRLFSRLGRLRGTIDMAHLQNADTARHAAFMQARDDAERAAAQAQWDRTFHNAAQALFNDASDLSKHHMATWLLRHEVLDGRLALTWLLQGQHTTPCYGLNRFLTTLVLTAYAHESGRPLEHTVATPDPASIVITEHEIAAVSGHGCERRPHQCHGVAHEVTLRSTGSAPPILQPQHFHSMVLRHGLEPALLFGGARQREQYMPFGLFD